MNAKLHWRTQLLIFYKVLVRSNFRNLYRFPRGNEPLISRDKINFQWKFRVVVCND